jgi:ubiquinone/menaquinone biosynthesis C-methylase UbiE
MMIELDKNLSAYYNQGREETRLSSGVGKLEFARTQELLQRYLPPAPATILDVGGGAGVYAFWLAQLGYHVHLIDVMPLHIEQAQRRMEGEAIPLASAKVGDARRLDIADNTLDAVLLLGPLYHLTEREERLAALGEVYRVLKPGGLLFAAAISRFASFVGALTRGLLADSQFVETIHQTFANGQHRNPTEQEGRLTRGFFHHPDELRDEIQDRKFVLNTLVAVEGLGMTQQDFDNFWSNEVQRKTLMELIRRTETEPSLIGASPHIMAVAHKPE